VAVREQLWPVTLRDMRRDDLPTVLDIERRSFSQPWSERRGLMRPYRLNSGCQ